MSVTKVHTGRGGRSGSRGVDARSYKFTYRVELDSYDDLIRLAIIANDGTHAIPAIGSGYPTDTSVVVSDIQAEQVGEEMMADVTVTWTTRKTDKEENPLDDKPSLKWGFQTYQKVVEKDTVTGKPITSSAHEPLVPGLVRNEYNLTCTITRNEATYNALTARNLIGKVNNASVVIAGVTWAAGNVLMLDWSGERQERNGVEYYAVSYQFEFARSSWQEEVLDQGTYYYDSGGNKQLFRDGGERAATTRNLDGAGGPLAAGADAEFLNYWGKELASFAALTLSSV